MLKMRDVSRMMAASVEWIINVIARILAESRSFVSGGLTEGKAVQQNACSFPQVSNSDIHLHLRLRLTLFVSKVRENITYLTSLFLNHHGVFSLIIEAD